MPATQYCAHRSIVQLGQGYAPAESLIPDGASLADTHHASVRPTPLERLCLVYAFPIVLWDNLPGRPNCTNIGIGPWLYMATRSKGGFLDPTDTTLGRRLMGH
jgi:hypothetical protein